MILLAETAAEIATASPATVLTAAVAVVTAVTSAMVAIVVAVLKHLRGVKASNDKAILAQVEQTRAAQDHCDEEIKRVVGGFDKVVDAFERQSAAAQKLFERTMVRIAEENAKEREARQKTAHELRNMANVTQMAKYILERDRKDKEVKPGDSGIHG